MGGGILSGDYGASNRLCIHIHVMLTEKADRLTGCACLLIAGALLLLMLGVMLGVSCE